MRYHLTRRGFLRDAAMAVLAAGFAPVTSAQALAKRVDWTTFTQGPDYSSFMDAIKKMRANTTATDRRSWQYWANVHQNYCPHGAPYFLAWHRGFITLLERQMREVSGNPALNLPYWDYYTDPNVPAEFLDSSSWNPLYVGRLNSNVAQSLTLNPFSASLVNLQRGLSNSFEVSLESQPHNPIHDIVGGIFSTMQAPIDPIFWLHHANVDRLWSAWVAAGGGRAQPAAADAYWTGTFTYAPKLTLARSATIDTRTSLGAFYDRETLPTALPLAALSTDQDILLAATDDSVAANALMAASMVASLPRRPALGSFRASSEKAISAKEMSLGGATDIMLNRSSVSARVGLSKTGQGNLKSMLASFRASPFGKNKPGQQYTSAKVVLSNVSVTSAGADGGYFYNLYLNLPDLPSVADIESNYLFGNVGPFRIDAGRHHGHGSSKGIDLEFDVTDLLLANPGIDLSTHTFSFVRISGENTPAGDTISIGECRLQLS